MGSPQVNNSELIGSIFRYGIVISLLTITLINIFNTNVQFIMFIVLLITFVFSITFVVRDIMLTQGILTESNIITSITSTSINFRNIFLGSIGIGVIFKIISLTLFIVVLNYGRSQLSSSNTSTNSSLTTDNEITFKNYIVSFIISIIFLGLLTAMLFIMYASYNVRIAIINVTSILLSLAILGLSSYEMYCSSRFFDVYKSNGIIYQTT